MPEDAKNLMKRVEALKTPTIEEALGARWACSLFLANMSDPEQKLKMLQSHMRANWHYLRALQK